MRFLVDVHANGDGDWPVAVRAEGESAALATRVMRRLPSASGLAVPLPPAEVANELPATAVHRPLCTATDPAVVLDALARLSTRRGERREAEAFGRYLFACLLGEQAWSAIGARAGPGGAIELSLRWGAEERDLYRFPWELMHGPNGFLATHQDRRIAITRLVTPAAVPGAPAGGPLALEIRPRVLFVVGSGLADPAIQAGAEWAGLLRRLTAQGVALISHVLVEATSQQLRDAVASFEPSIVHFICHGAIEADGGRIYLMSDEEDGSEEPLRAGQIVELLDAGGVRPPVVVLNACSTGGGAAVAGAMLSTPLAAELVEAGVPIVVAHTGRVADRACRLFARRFYEALLQGEDLPQAVAEGRRTARALGSDPAAGIDWALPALFLADGVEPAVRLSGAAAVAATARRAAAFRRLANPPAFCGRLECMSVFDNLLRDRGLQPKRVLAYEVVERDQRFRDSRYGKTRLLQELAARAVHEGMAPCLVSFPAGDVKPKNALELGLSIVRAIRETREMFGLPVTPPEGFQTQLARRQVEGDAGVALAAEVQDELDLQPGKRQLDGRVVGAALRFDLAALAAALPAPARSVSALVVLIDEVNEFGDAARELLELMLTQNGFGSMARPIPVVLAYSGSTVAGEGATAAQALTAFFETGPSHVARVRLGAFRGPVEDRLAYRQFLLNLETPLVPADLEADAAQVGKFFERLHSKVGGVPSRLEQGEPNDSVFTVIETAEDLGFLRRANDEDALEELRRHLP